MRIDKFLTECGICSRKEAGAAARRGGITVNGAPAKDASAHIDPERDRVAFLGREVVYRRFTYVMLNKPAGYVSATEDEKLPVVTELLPLELQKIGLFPVGRLDRDTLGLMILTNNGPLAHSLLSPRHHVEKEYRFTCRDPLPEGTEERFAGGVMLSDGYECKSAVIRPAPDRLGGTIVLTEGKYHQIKRMLEALDNKITSLERIRFADIPLDPSLPRGGWRLLTKEEIASVEAANEAGRAAAKQG